MSRDGVTSFSPDVLRRTMTMQDISADELAQRVGASASSVSTWLTGKARPSPRMLVRIAMVLQVAQGSLTPDVIGCEKLADLRINAGLTQTAVAPELGIGTTLLGVIERGRKGIYPHLVEPMADLYGVAVDDVTAAWHRTMVNRPSLGHLA